MVKWYYQLRSADDDGSVERGAARVQGFFGRASGGSVSAGTGRDSVVRQ